MGTIQSEISEGRCNDHKTTEGREKIHGRKVFSFHHGNNHARAEGRGHFNHEITNGRRTIITDLKEGGGGNQERTEGRQTIIRELNMKGGTIMGDNQERI